MKNFIRLAMIIFLMMSLYNCGFQKETLFSGATMGTTYHIKVVTGYFRNAIFLQTKIDARLEEINKSMSIYIDMLLFISSSLASIFVWRNMAFRK